MPIHAQAATRTADLKPSAGVRLAVAPERRTDRDEYEATRAELINRHQREDGGAVMACGSRSRGARRRNQQRTMTVPDVRCEQGVLAS